MFAPFIPGGSGIPLPVDVAVGDFDGDGDPDLVAAHSGGIGVSVLLGNGDGTFGSRVVYQVTDTPYRVFVEDFDGDNEIDICASLLFDRKMALLRGNGDGTFAPAVVVETDGFPLGLADLNGDGAIDVVSQLRDLDSPSLDFQLRVTLNDGSGGVGLPILLPAAANRVAIADITGDGVLDLVGLTLGSGVVTLEGAGDGTFAVLQTRSTQDRSDGVATGDLDGDGDLDVLVTEDIPNARGEVTVFKNDGAGSLDLGTSYLASRSPGDIVVADVTLDGIPDAVTTGTMMTGSVAAVLPGQAGGTLGQWVEFPTAVGPNFAVKSADFDLDGAPDLALASQNGRTISTLLNELSAGPCGAADLAEPFGALNIDDVLAYLNGFATSDPSADLADPAGVFNIDDVLAFLDAFAAGCP